VLPFRYRIANKPYPAVRISLWRTEIPGLGIGRTIVIGRTADYVWNVMGDRPLPGTGAQQKDREAEGERGEPPYSLGLHSIMGSPVLLWCSPWTAHLAKAPKITGLKWTAEAVMRTRPLRKLVTRDIGPVGRGEAGGNPRCRQVYGRMSRERQMLSSSEPVGKTPALDSTWREPLGGDRG